jgi:hypothetical protein
MNFQINSQLILFLLVFLRVKKWRNLIGISISGMQMVFNVLFNNMIAFDALDPSEPFKSNLNHSSGNDIGLFLDFLFTFCLLAINKKQENKHENPIILDFFAQDFSQIIELINQTAPPQSQAKVIYTLCLLNSNRSSMKYLIFLHLIYPSK